MRIRDARRSRGGMGGAMSRTSSFLSSGPVATVAPAPAPAPSPGLSFRPSSSGPTIASRLQAASVASGPTYRTMPPVQVPTAQPVIDHTEQFVTGGFVKPSAPSAAAPTHVVTVNSDGSNSVEPSSSSRAAALAPQTVGGTFGSMGKILLLLLALGVGVYLYNQAQEGA
jgi:hypothetical protein